MGPRRRFSSPQQLAAGGSWGASSWARSRDRIVKCSAEAGRPKCPRVCGIKACSPKSAYSWHGLETREAMNWCNAGWQRACAGVQYPRARHETGAPQARAWGVGQSLFCAARPSQTAGPARKKGVKGLSEGPWGRAPPPPGAGAVRRGGLWHAPWHPRSRAGGRQPSESSFVLGNGGHGSTASSRKRKRPRGTHCRPALLQKPGAAGWRPRPPGR